jgi:hypothetical protein
LKIKALQHFIEIFQPINLVVLMKFWVGLQPLLKNFAKVALMVFVERSNTKSKNKFRFGISFGNYLE